MLSLGTIDLALGIIFIFGVTTAISSVATELIERLGLRGATGAHFYTMNAAERDYATSNLSYSNEGVAWRGEGSGHEPGKCR